ncbi:expansin family protein [Boletus coccyginus]|nr:expansin family protein [Boletus coccyginus]
MHFSRGVLAACFALLPPLVGGAATNTTRTRVTPGNYHSLTESYQFNPRDGWESVMVTNLRYKYRRSSTGMTSTATPVKNSSSALERPSSTSTRHSSAKSVFRSVGESLAEFTKGIIAIGKAEDVIITWYTGHDLLNPSCWTEPTDKSFVAALTLDGWSEKPKCFKFIELCKDSTKCIFVRVVDTCAGCEKGSKHVDLTQAAFEELAPLSKGVLNVQMREASEPTNW